MEIVVAFSSPKEFNLSSSIIKAVMGTKYSHVLVYWKAEKLDRRLVYQASHGSVHFLELDNFLKNNEVHSEHLIEITQEQYVDLVRRCVDLAGQPYGFCELANIAINDLANYAGLKVDFGDGKGYICSELLADLLISVCNATFKKPKHLIKPKDIEDFLIANKLQ